MIEILTRLFLACNKATGKELPITVSDSFEAVMNTKKTVNISFNCSEGQEVCPDSS